MTSAPQRIAGSYQRSSLTCLPRRQHALLKLLSPCGVPMLSWCLLTLYSGICLDIQDTKLSTKLHVWVQQRMSAAERSW